MFERNEKDKNTSFTPMMIDAIKILFTLQQNQIFRKILVKKLKILMTATRGL